MKPHFTYEEFKAMSFDQLQVLAEANRRAALVAPPMRIKTVADDVRTKSVADGLPLSKTDQLAEQVFQSVNRFVARRTQALEDRIRALEGKK